MPPSLYPLCHVAHVGAHPPSPFHPHPCITISLLSCFLCLRHVAWLQSCRSASPSSCCHTLSCCFACVILLGLVILPRICHATWPWSYCFASVMLLRFCCADLLLPGCFACVMLPCLCHATLALSCSLASVVPLCFCHAAPLLSYCPACVMLPYLCLLAKG